MKGSEHTKTERHDERERGGERDGEGGRGEGGREKHTNQHTQHAQRSVPEAVLAGLHFHDTTGRLSTNAVYNN